MAELTYRDAVIRGIAQEMTRDPDVVFLGEDVGKAGGVFKATVGLYEQFGPLRVRDTPISEQAIMGAAMGAAMTGLKPIAEIMFSDFFAVCFDYIANEFPKSRYMSNGQVKCPLVIRTGNGAGSRFGAQHSQSVENWCMMIPGLKVVAPSSPRDVIGLLAASVRDPDPVIFLEHKSLYATKGEVPDGEIVDRLGTASIVRPGKDATVAAGQVDKIDVKLVPTRNLTAQLTNAEWLMSMPGSDDQKRFVLECNSCHTLQRIVRSTHDAAEFLQVFRRMGSYYPGSTPLKPQPLAGNAARLAGQMANYLAQDIKVRACDRNPFKVQVSIATTLGGAANRLSAALQQAA